MQSRKNIQVPLLYFNDEEDREYHDRSGVRLFIRSFWLESEQLLIPYIATIDEYGEIIKPYKIPSGYFHLPPDPYRGYRMKLRKLCFQMPDWVGRQYFYAEALKVRGATDRTAIETGAVIRNLLELIEKPPLSSNSITRSPYLQYSRRQSR